MNLAVELRRRFLPENTNLITIEELRALQDNAWTAKPSDSLASQDILLWHAADELATDLEISTDPERFVQDQPRIWMILDGAEAYFLEIGSLPSHAVAHVLLMGRRCSHGLTPRGGEK